MADILTICLSIIGAVTLVILVVTLLCLACRCCRKRASVLNVTHRAKITSRNMAYPNEGSFDRPANEDGDKLSRHFADNNADIANIESGSREDYISMSGRVDGTPNLKRYEKFRNEYDNETYNKSKIKELASSSKASSQNNNKSHNPTTGINNHINNTSLVLPSISHKLPTTTDPPANHSFDNPSFDIAFRNSVVAPFSSLFDTAHEDMVLQLDERDRRFRQLSNCNIAALADGATTNGEPTATVDSVQKSTRNPIGPTLHTRLADGENQDLGDLPSPGDLKQLIGECVPEQKVDNVLAEAIANAQVEQFSVNYAIDDMIGLWNSGNSMDGGTNDARCKIIYQQRTPL